MSSSRDSTLIVLKTARKRKQNKIKEKLKEISNKKAVKNEQKTTVSLKNFQLQVDSTYMSAN